MRTPDYYRARAAEMRRLGEKAADPSIRETYLDIAADWDKLAAHLQAAKPRSRSMVGQYLVR